MGDQRCRYNGDKTSRPTYLPVRYAARLFVFAEDGKAAADKQELSTSVVRLDAPARVQQKRHGKGVNKILEHRNGLALKGEDCAQQPRILPSKARTSP